MLVVARKIEHTPRRFQDKDSITFRSSVYYQESTAQYTTGYQIATLIKQENRHL